MNPFEWNVNYSVDIESIDNDHKALFGIINQLFSAMTEGKAMELVKETVQQLENYSKTHFQREEIFFKTTNYPGFAEHKLQHDLFIEKVKGFKKEISEKNTHLSIEILGFLRDWLINHIKISDKQYKDHLKKYGIR